MSGERVTISEASELTGISMPTMHRRIKKGELRAVMCIDSKGKHWEVELEALSDLQLKHRLSAKFKESSSPVEEEKQVGAGVSAGAGQELKVDNSLEVAKGTAKETVSWEEWQSLQAQLATWQERCRLVEAQLQEEKLRNSELNGKLQEAWEDASYYRGRWEESDACFQRLSHLNEVIEASEGDSDLDAIEQ